ncbi:MAG TPA: hypothetical protein VFW11_15750 [Cyclobacteriaceae bacterium]|nr:hypothetical protein [Cyclobacteriaceae bacterium]
MKPKNYLMTLLTLSTLTLYGQTKKCDETNFHSISEKVGKLTQNEIADFLLTFGEECRNNVEYSELSNELLFKLLDKQTELTLKTIEKEESKIELKTILEDLEEPISYTPDFKKLLTKINAVSVNDKLKGQVIERLKTADEKY